MSDHVPSDIFFDPDDHDLAKRIILKLGNNRRDKSNPATVAEINTWLQRGVKRGRIERVLKKIMQSGQCPIAGNLSNDRVYVTKEYFKNPGFDLDSD